MTVRTSIVAAAVACVAWLTPGRAEPAKPAVPAAKSAEEKKRLEEQKLNETWNAVPLEEKQWVLRFCQAMREMPREERALINDRFERFLQMTREERELMKQNYARWQQMSPEQRQKAREEYQRHRQAFEEDWKKKHPDQPVPALRFSVSSVPPTPTYGDEFQLMILELNLQGDQLKTFQLKLGERLKAIDAWNQSASARQLAELEKRLQKARESKDTANLQALQGPFDRLRQEALKLRSSQRAEVMSILTLEQQQRWAGYVLFDRVSHRNFRKTMFSKTQAEQARAICNEIAAKFVKEDTIAQDPYLGSLDKLLNDVADNVRANVLASDASEEQPAPAGSERPANAKNNG